MADVYTHPVIKHRYTDFGKSYVKATYYRVKYRDIFNLKYFYILLHEWTIENEYAPRKDSTFPETFHLLREESQRGNELWLRWRLTKTPSVEGSKYWQYHIDIIMHCLAIKPTEIMHQGKKFKANSGEAEVKVWSHLSYDHKAILDKHPIMKYFRKSFFDRYLSTKIDKLRKQLYYDSYRLQEAIKTYMKLKTYLPEPGLSKFWHTRDLEQ